MEQSEEGISVDCYMHPPQPGTFQDREQLIKYVRDFGASQGYAVTIKKSRKDRRVILGCDRGGVYRNRRKIDESQRKRKASSRLINCPFEVIGKKDEEAWVLTIKHGEHNHEALKDMSEHPYSRRFTEEEILRIKSMTEAGAKPRQVLKTLKQSNPELQSTPRHLYNLKAKIRQGTLSEKNIISGRPGRHVSLSTSTSMSEETSKQDSQLLKVSNFIGGKFVDSQGCSIIDAINPATQEVVSQVPSSTYEEFKAAITSAKQAFPFWKNTPVSTRQCIMFKLHELIRRDIDKIAMKITTEQGKTLKNARSDVLRGLEVLEHACGIANLQMGEYIPNKSNGIDTYIIREPLGVCAGICASNFPASTPLWMFPIAVTCGNTFILKPCGKNPGAAMVLAELAMEAGLPDGVLNVVHGANDIVDYIGDDNDIKAISLVGSNAAGMRIHARAASKGKRVQSYTGGKNHVVIMADATFDATLDALIAAAFVGEAMVAIFVGDSTSWEEQLVEHTKALKVSVGTDPEADLGPVITKEAKDRICRLVHDSLENGARLVLDGRKVTVPGYENGNFVGPTILCDVTANMDCYKEDIFGPVLLCMQAGSLEEAITTVNRSRLGHGASIFTASAVFARKFQNEVEAEMVGINVPVSSPFSLFYGSTTCFSGRSGVQFYTQTKTVAQQWKDLPSDKDMTGRAALCLLSNKVSASRETDSESPSQQAIYIQERSGSFPSTSERTDVTLAFDPERLYVPTRHAETSSHMDDHTTGTSRQNDTSMWNYSI